VKARSAARPGGSGKEIAVELDDNDMTDVDGFQYLSAIERFRAMSDRADLMLVEYLLRRGDISREYAEQRIREIREQSAR
jgi:hypothetical protein